MFDIFIKQIQIDEVRNLSNFNIDISETQKRNLIITGKNGVGKTSLLVALVNNMSYLIEVGDYKTITDHISSFNDALDRAVKSNQSQNEIARFTELLNKSNKDLVKAKSGINLIFNNPQNSLKAHFENNEFVVAYYDAKRVFSAETPEHIEKMELKDRYSLKEQPRTEFVKYITDLKMKEALSRTSGKNEVADAIHTWFEKFNDLLKTIFEDASTTLEFDEETFDFSIKQDNKVAFGFNTLSDGYAAVLDIVVDIMMRMEKYNDRRFVFNMPGIVLIDEIETHLHIELQRNVMKLLTTVFPNIQFIVTTHSPFILANTENAVVFDLENRTLVKDGLTNLPYEGIVEGYFGVERLSEELKEKFNRYRELVKKEHLSDEDILEITRLENYLEEIPDYLSLDISTEFHELKLAFQSRGDL